MTGGSGTKNAPAASRARLAAVVLAAGRSKRMGTDKAFLRLGDESALARVLRILRATGIPTLIAVTRECGPRLRAAADLEGVTTARNPDPAAEQTSSIRIAMSNLPEAVDGFLLCPVDVPLFEAADVDALADAFAARARGVEIVVPSHDGRRGHPALFARALAAEFRRLEDGEPAHAVVRRDPARVLHVVRDNPWLVRDLDTPRDLAAAQHWLAARG